MRQAAYKGRLLLMTKTSEETFYEGGPAKGDLIVNLFAGLTLIGLPFTIAAIVRALWLRFLITNRRVSVTGGWLGRNKTQVAYSQVSELRSVPRGFGSWGDMVLVMRDGARLEMRSVPNFRETEEYILKLINQRKKEDVTQNKKGFSD